MHFFWFGFSDFALTNCGFRALVGLQVFFQSSLRFSVFVSNDGGFSEFSV